MAALWSFFLIAQKESEPRGLRLCLRALERDKKYASYDHHRYTQNGVCGCFCPLVITTNRNRGGTEAQTREPAGEGGQLGPLKHTFRPNVAGRYEI